MLIFNEKPFYSTKLLSLLPDMSIYIFIYVDFESRIHVIIPKIMNKVRKKEKNVQTILTHLHTVLSTYVSVVIPAEHHIQKKKHISAYFISVLHVNTWQL